MGNKLVNVQVMKNAIGHDLPVAVHQAHFLCSKNANSRAKMHEQDKRDYCACLVFTAYWKVSLLFNLQKSCNTKWWL